jgi:hypothetical protein
VLPRDRLPRRPPFGFEAERIDDGEEPALQTACDDVVHDVERVRARAQVVLALTDDAAQRVRRDDLVRLEVRGRPRRLA